MDTQARGHGALGLLCGSATGRCTCLLVRGQVKRHVRSIAVAARAAKLCTKCSWQGKHLPGEGPFFSEQLLGLPWAAIHLQGIAFSPLPLPRCGKAKQRSQLLRRHPQGKGARGLCDRVRGGGEGCRLPVFMKASFGNNVEKTEMR